MWWNLSQPYNTTLNIATTMMQSSTNTGIFKHYKHNKWFQHWDKRIFRNYDTCNVNFNFFIASTNQICGSNIILKLNDSTLACADDGSCGKRDCDVGVMIMFTIHLADGMTLTGETVATKILDGWIHNATGTWLATCSVKYLLPYLCNTTKRINIMWNASRFKYAQCNNINCSNQFNFNQWTDKFK